MGIFVSLDTTVKDGKFADFEAFLKENLPNVRRFEGALSVDILYDEETRALKIFEEWKSRQHHGAYLDFISSNGVMEQLVAYLDKPPSVQYYQNLGL